MSCAGSSDPRPPGPDFLAAPPFQQPGPPQNSSPESSPTPHSQFHAPMSQNTAPSRQVPPLYGAHRQPEGPKRPGPATTAAVLGIISGSLGLFPAIATLLTVAKILEEVEGDSAGPMKASITILLPSGLATTATVIALLVAGITFLKGKGYTVLLSAVIAQLALTAFYVVIMLLALESIIWSIRNMNSSAAGLVIIIFCALVGLGLAISNLVLLCKPATRRWAKRVS